MDWLQRVAENVVLYGPTARILIVETSGPTPRAAGAAMLVTATGQKGRIGRGEVERTAVEEARRLVGEVEAAASLTPLWRRQVLHFESGLVLGERSHGAIMLLVEIFAAPEVEVLRRRRLALQGPIVLGRPLASGVPADLFTEGDGASPGLGVALRSSLPRALVRLPSKSGSEILVERIAPRRAQFCVYGTGLVARALVKVLSELPYDTVWLDSVPSNFPARVPELVEARTVADLADAARATRTGAFHAVMTASHDLDLVVCRALLKDNSFAYLGVIGSSLKRERLLARLAGEGFSGSLLARIICPIGLPEIRSKVPEVIAIAIAAQALTVAQAGELATTG